MKYILEKIEETFTKCSVFASRYFLPTAHTFGLSEYFKREFLGRKTNYSCLKSVICELKGDAPFFEKQSHKRAWLYHQVMPCP
jgi:hypothetical protein